MAIAGFSVQLRHFAGHRYAEVNVSEQESALDISYDCVRADVEVGVAQTVQRIYEINKRIDNFESPFNGHFIIKIEHFLNSRSIVADRVAVQLDSRLLVLFEVFVYKGIFK